MARFAQLLVADTQRWASQNQRGSRHFLLGIQRHPDGRLIRLPDDLEEPLRQVVHRRGVDRLFGLDDRVIRGKR